MADVSTLLEEWAQILDGTLHYLRTHAANELPYGTVVRIERNAHRSAHALLTQLGVYDETGRPATDELLATAVAPRGRQSVQEQVLGSGQVDDGPEGVAADANRELSDEAMPTESVTFTPLPEEDEEEDTAPPGTSVPVLPEVDEIADLDDFDDFDEVETGEVQQPPQPVGGLVGQFDDFDDDNQETQVLGLAESAEQLQALLNEQTDPGRDSFDLMPDLDQTDDLSQLSDDDDLEELEELDLELDLELDDDDLEFEELDDIEELEPEPVPEPVRAPPQRRAASATAGLYGNPNVPTIRETPSPAPRAAAIQLNAQTGQSKVLGLEEEQAPLEIGSAEDYGEEEEESNGGGFGLQIQEYEDDDDDPIDEEEEQPPLPEPPVYRGPDPAQIAAVLEQAKVAAARGDMQRGIELFGDVCDADPDSVEALVGRGRLYLDLGDYSRAMSDFMTAEDITPTDPEPQVAIGDLYFARKDYRKAIDYFNEALKMDPNHAMAHCRRGISHYYRKNYAEALEDLQTAERLDEDIPNIGTYISMARKKAKKA